MTAQTYSLLICIVCSIEKQLEIEESLMSDCTGSIMASYVQLFEQYC